FKNQLCNKGTALAGPKKAARKRGFNPCGMSTGFHLAIFETRSKQKGWDTEKSPVHTLPENSPASDRNSPPARLCCLAPQLRHNNM
ncbi:MAG: hypothetical protein ACLPZY_19630, partial [Terracidiphilus sp.]